MSQEKIVIRYFDIRGKAEAIRLLFEEAGIEYSEERITREEWFEKGKKKEYIDKQISPFGQLPIVSIGDFHMAQTNAILRYFAKQKHMHGSTDLSQYRCDMLLDGVEDWRMNYSRMIYNPQHEQLVGPYINETCPKFLAQFETLLKQNVNESSALICFISDTVSVADIAVFDMLELTLRLNAKALDSYPLLQKFSKQMAARPKIKAYLESGKRPEKVNNVPRG